MGWTIFTLMILPGVLLLTWGAISTRALAAARAEVVAQKAEVARLREVLYGPAGDGVLGGTVQCEKPFRVDVTVEIARPR